MNIDYRDHIKIKVGNKDYYFSESTLSHLLSNHESRELTQLAHCVTETTISVRVLKDWLNGGVTD